MGFQIFSQKRAAFFHAEGICVTAVIIKIRFEVHIQLFVVIVQVQEPVSGRCDNIRYIIILALFFLRHGIG